MFSPMVSMVVEHNGAETVFLQRAEEFFYLVGKNQAFKILFPGYTNVSSG